MYRNQTTEETRYYADRDIDLSILRLKLRRVTVNCLAFSKEAEKFLKE